ncbi:hypothetical protein [Fictibacillus phosphorivorans]|uniref:hypothetical protein n=1 Tax=Fictibacillus phosphorivorans TaxID=1221500 RepID=UPI0035E7AED3
MAQMTSRSRQQPPLLRVEPFKGINLSVTPTQIDQNQSPDMLNMNIDERGALNKRTGYERVFETSLGAGKVNGIFEFRQANGTKELLFAHSDKLYKLADLTVLKSGLADAPMSAFVLGGKMYFMNGTDFFSYDGTTIAEITPYIPTLTISNQPTGGGEKFEDFNLLGAGFKETYSGDATAKDFQLSLKGLDATPVTAKVGTVAKVEGTDFTVDRVNGKVTFTAAPATGTNNVEITAYKTQAGFSDRIKKCTIHALFGGANDTRVFVSGNPDFPNQMWRSGLYDATYFPENGFYKIGSEREKITGFAKQYDYLVIEKENSKGNMQYQLNEGGEPTFPIKPINDQIGTVASKSIQIIDNNPVSLGKTGVYELVSSNVRDERNIQHISESVDGQLLNEPNLKDAISVDYDRKYWLAINNKVYVYDYPIREWYLYDNIPASCFLESDGILYFGGEGIVFKFKKESHITPYNDDGQVIQAYWKSKYFTFGHDERRKVVDKVFFGLKPYSRTSADLYYVSDKKTSNLLKTKRMDMMDFNIWNFNFMSFVRSNFPQETMVKIKAKKVTMFQLIIENNRLDESMGILSLGIKYRLSSEVK